MTSFFDDFTEKLLREEDRYDLDLEELGVPKRKRGVNAAGYDAAAEDERFKAQLAAKDEARRQELTRLRELLR